jgi:hypothetical protein
MLNEIESCWCLVGFVGRGSLSAWPSTITLAVAELAHERSQFVVLCSLCWTRVDFAGNTDLFTCTQCASVECIPSAIVLCDFQSQFPSYGLTLDRRRGECSFGGIFLVGRRSEYLSSRSCGPAVARQKVVSIASRTMPLLHLVHLKPAQIRPPMDQTSAATPSFVLVFFRCMMPR